MQRKNLLYLVAVLALLISMFPAAAIAQEAPPAQSGDFTIQTYTPPAETKGASPGGKASQPGSSLDGMLIPDGMNFFNEVELNNTPGTANALPGTNLAILGNIYPNADVDYFSFTGSAGDRVYAATMTSFSANGSSDSQLRLYASDGVTVIEFDDDDGTFGGLSSSIAGATLPADGTYYLAVNHFSATNQLRPYHLHLRVQSGSPVPESEPNDTPATANPLPPSGWVSGARNPAVATEQDWFSFSANAGDTVYLSLDLDPERDATTWNGRLGIALFGDADNQILVVDDASVTSPNSEALFMTVKNAGTYYAFVDSATAATGGPTATYNLSVSILPKAAGNCTTYTSTDVPKTIGPSAGLTSSTITVPGNPRIADLDVSIQLDAAVMADIDAQLRSPAGNDNGLFTDIGASATGGQTLMDVTFDDEAAIPPAFTVLKGLVLEPELAYRLSWFDGEDAGGVWTLDLRDDLTNTNAGGNLTGWSITICEPPPPPVCPAGYESVTLYSQDFEASDGGYTHSGVADEWEWGTPAFPPITTCASGVNCWATDLDNTYDFSSNQDLVSPAIDLTNADLVGPATVYWSQRYQMESASFDHAEVRVREAGGANPTNLWTWLDATMTNPVGSPSTTIQESAGWGVHSADISSYLGQNIDMLFHVDTDSSVNFAGLAIDDVAVTACQPVLVPSISLDKTVGTDPNTCAMTDEITVAPNTDVTYCYTVENTGDVPFNTHDLDDSELGALLTNFFYQLDPGASVFLTETANIAVTTVNTATWSAELVPQEGNYFAQATDVATVTVETQAPAIVLTKTVGLDPNVCAVTDDITVPSGTDVTYCYTVENTGDVTLNLHDLDDSELGSILSGFPYALAPGASAFLTATTTINVTTVNTGTWTAYNNTDVQVCSTPNLAIPDNNPAGVSDTLDSTTSGLISDLDVFINTTHTWVGDLIYTLQHVDTGTIVTLINRPGAPPGTVGCNGNDINNTVDDEATLSFESNCTTGTNPTQAYVAGEHYQGGDPASSTLMTAFDGEDLSGDWTLTVSDNAGADTGTLNEWCLVTAGSDESVSASDVATVTVQGEPPNIYVDPLSMDSTQATNTQVQQTLTISNTGGGTLDWTIDEEDTTLPFIGAFNRDATGQSAAGTTHDVVVAGEATSNNAAPEKVNIWRGPDAVLWDNGPLVNCPGCGAGGADVSRLESITLGMNVLGFGHQISANNWMADDFVVSDAAGWDVSSFTFFAYQTGSTTTSTMTAVNWELYDGQPGAGGSVIASGSGLNSTGWTNIYRDSESAPGGTTRPIMANTVNTPMHLPAGTYWVAWQAAGTLASGPWAPPITILGQTATGNGLQFIGSTATWNPAIDLSGGVGTGAPQGLPFIVEGEVASGAEPCELPSDIPWLSLDATNGSNGGGTDTDVTVTFDSTGYGAGTYTGNLCVSSDDPDPGPGNETDLVIVPVTMTVEAVQEDPNIFVDPLSMASTQATNTQVQQTLTISNTGGGTLDWLIDEEDTTAPVNNPPFVAGSAAPSAGMAPNAAPAAMPAVTPLGELLGSNAYSWNSQNGPYYTIFDIDVPGTLPNIAPFAAGGNFVGAGELVGSFVYMIDNSNTMYEVVPATGAINNSYAVTAPPGAQTYSGMALDPTTGVVYASSTDVAASTLFTIVPATGVATLIGPITNSPANIAISFDGAGNLYGYDILTNSMFAINKATGFGTDLGPLPFDPNFGQGMGYDPATDTVYLAGFNNGTFQAELWTYDTGANTYAYMGVLGGVSPGGLNQLSWLGFADDQPAEPCLLPSDIPWLTLDVTNGSNAGGTDTDVTVTFDSTGYGAGTYTGNLCVSSNDPDPGPGNETDLVIVPVTMTVEAVQEDPNIFVDPLSMAAAQPADVQTQQLLNVANTGGGTLNWVIDEDVTSGPEMVDWSDNFDSYATGSQLAGQGGWQGWDGNPAFGALASNAQALSAPNSADILGATDLVHQYSGYSSGQWVYKAMQYVPGNFSGQSYFILLNTYNDNGPYNWSFQLCADSTTGMVYDDIAANCVGGSSLPLVTDQWVEIRAEIDLDADTLAVYYNNQLLVQDTWTGHVSGGGAANIGAVDLFANSASSVFYDDMSLTEVVANVACDAPSDIPWLSLDAYNGSNGGGTDTNVTVTFDSTGLTPGVYTGSLCVTSNDPDPGPGNETDLVIVPVTLTVQPPTAVALTGLSAGTDQMPAPAGVPLGAVAAAGLSMALAAGYALRRRRQE